MPTKRLLVEKKRDAFITKTDAELRKQDFSKDSIKNYKFHVGRYIDDQGVTVAKSSYCLCISCFKKWKSVGGDLKLMDNLSNVKKEHIIYMSKIMKGNCGIVKGHKLYIALKKAIS